MLGAIAMAEHDERDRRPVGGRGSGRGFELTTFHVRRAKAGDRESLAWLFLRLKPLLLAQARYRMGRSLSRICDAEDLVNEVWVLLLDRIGELEARGGRETPVLLKFLSTALLYQVNNHLRKHIRRGEKPGADRDTQLPSATSPDPGGATRAEVAERIDAVLAALDTLPPRDREILILRGVEQKENMEVARLLGESANAVSLRYNRALQKLRETLPESVFEELG